MNFIAANNIDIYALFVVIVVTLVLFMKVLVKLIYKRLFSKSNKEKMN